MRTLSSKRSFDLDKNKNGKRPLGFFVVVCCAAPLFLVQSWAGQQQIRQKGNRRISPKRDRVKLSCCSWNSKTMRLPSNQHFYERWCFFFFCVCVCSLRSIAAVNPSDREPSPSDLTLEHSKRLACKDKDRNVPHSNSQTKRLSRQSR